MVLEFGEGYILRHALVSDHAALKLVCLRTGDSGKDATLLEDDPDLLGLIYAVPYQVYEPEFAYVVEGPDGVCGYVLGALDTRSFYARLAADWYPALAAGVTDPGDNERAWRGSDWARFALHHPDLVYPAALLPYPAHGHIDLLEHARRRGIGSRALGHLMVALRDAGAPGMHLQVSPRNRGARIFYRKIGFTVAEDPQLPAHTTFMVRHF